MDESGFTHETTRSYGYAKIGKRCQGVSDYGVKARTNIIGALLEGVLLAVCLFEFNVNADVFQAWVQ
jgi:hypothetical protein